MDIRLYETKKYILENEKISVLSHCASGHIRKHRHDFIEITYIVNGEGIHEISGNNYNIVGGSLFFIDCNQIHSMNITKETNYYEILLSPSFISDTLKDCGSVDTILYYLMDGSENKLDYNSPVISFSKDEIIMVENFFKLMYNEFTKKREGYLIVIKSYLYLILMMMIRAIRQNKNTETLLAKDKLLPTVIEYVNDNFCEKISMSDVGRRYSYNPSYFSRIFKSTYGVNFSTYIQKKRIEKAVDFLRIPILMLSDIQKKIGLFIIPKSFYTTLGIMGITPYEYRKASISSKKRLSNVKRRYII